MEYNRILLTSVNNLGDCVAFLPVAAAVRAQFPEARLTMLSRRAGLEVTKLTGLVDDFVEAVPARGIAGRLGMVPLAMSLRRRSLELALMASGDSSLVCAMLWLAGIRERVGFDDCRLSSMLTVRVVADEEEKEALRNLRLPGAIGLPASATRPPVRISDEARIAAHRRLEVIGVRFHERPITLFHPGSSNTLRRWPAECFAKTCDEVQREGLAQVVILEGPAEPGLGLHVARLSQEPAPVLSGIPNIESLAAVIAESDLFIGHSSGPTHVAFLLGVPTVSLWGDTRPEIWGPAWNLDRHVVIRSSIPCAGCERWTPGHIIRKTEECPPGDPKEHRLRCMEEIGVPLVVQAIRRQLAARFVREGRA